MNGNDRPILLVEDDAALGETLAEALADEGYPTVLASSGAEAMTLARTVQPRIVVIDYCVGGETAMEIVPALREELGAVPIILMSGSVNVRSLGARLGVAVLAKPFSIDQFVEKLCSLV